MAMSQSAIKNLVKDQLLPGFQSERERLKKVDCWYRHDPETLRLPRGASTEHRWLEGLAHTPWLNLVVTTVAQAMYVDGFRSPEQSDNEQVWRTWNANGFDARQVAVHRAALAYGYSYVIVTPGTDAQGPRAVMRGADPLRMYAVYQEPAWDDWPMYAMLADPHKDGWHLRVYDDETVYFLSADKGGAVTYIEHRDHGAGVCPVVKYSNQPDLRGSTKGEIEPLIPLAVRIDKTSYDRLLTQHFNSWKVRTVSGIDVANGPVDSDGDGAISNEERRAAADRAKILLRQSDILTADDPDTKFGTLDETPLDGFVNAYSADIETLAAVAQVPTTALTGKVANLSADAITELRAGLSQKVYERQRYFGHSHAQALRLAAQLEGDRSSAQDFDARISWQDMEVRSMSQAADALGKYAQMLGVPVEALWDRIPGVTQSDVAEWKNLARRQNAQSILSALAKPQQPQQNADGEQG